MGEKALVESLINDAIALIKKLDELEIPPTFAGWYYYADADEWRLLIASQKLDQLLPKQEPMAYRKVIEALSTTSPSSLGVSDLKLVETSYPLLKSLKYIVGTGPTGIGQVHMSNSTINGIFIKEIVILRSA